MQVFVFGGYLKGESRKETWFENTAACYSEFKTSLRGGSTNSLTTASLSFTPSPISLPQRCNSDAWWLPKAQLYPKDTALSGAGLLGPEGKVQLELCALKGALPSSTLVAHSDRPTGLVFLKELKSQSLHPRPSPPSSWSPPRSYISLVSFLLSRRKS